MVPPFWRDRGLSVARCSRHAFRGLPESAEGSATGVACDARRPDRHRRVTRQTRAHLGVTPQCPVAAAGPTPPWRRCRRDALVPVMPPRIVPAVRPHPTLPTARVVTMTAPMSARARRGTRDWERARARGAETRGRAVDAAAVEERGVEVAIVRIETHGDRRPPDTAWGEGAFVAAIERALIEGDIDAGVHSAKDLPTAFDDRLTIAAFLPREDPRCARHA